MADDLSDAGSRDELRAYRTGVTRPGSSASTFASNMYFKRFMPTRSHDASPWNVFVAGVGAVILAAIIVAFLLKDLGVIGT